MSEAISKNILVQLRRQWMYKAFLSQLLLALAFTLLICTILDKFISFPLYECFLVFIILFSIIIIINRSWKLNTYDVSRFLNSTKPSLEESAHLLLKSTASLNFLEKLQLKKVEKELLSFKAPNPFKKRITASLVILLMALVVSLVLFNISFKGYSSARENNKQTSFVNTKPEILLPEIKSVNIIIIPPSYTGNKLRQQKQLSLLVEEEAVVSWQIQTNVAAKEVQLIFNNGANLQLTGDDKHLNWKTQKQINTSGFYQVKIDNKLSELYKIEVIKDQPPKVIIQTPNPNTSINYGQSEKILIKTLLTDDYGIASANISATISSGDGEAVKFKQQKLVFENFAAGNKEYHLQKMIDCKSLGMQPGNELYFFVTITDNHKQETRSDIYIITLQDTANLANMNGMVLPLDIKPELFRSQRQIIIETEQLLKDKPVISAEKFRQKSNELGMDQDLLRIRYGKFLGEETNVEIGEDAHNNQDYTNNADEIIKQYSHEHDNSEDASFFDAATKKQLIAMLTEMWNAEVKLKIFLPKEALPHENKALLLLKDLQQKSRAYVPKTGFKSTPLKLEKRLTGDLTKISQPVTQQNFQKSEGSIIMVRRALGILEQLKVNVNSDASLKEILQKAFQQLSIAAANQPAVYLTSLSAFTRILNEDYTIRDINEAEQGLQKMAPSSERLPHSENDAGMKLSKQYFRNLNKVSR